MGRPRAGDRAPLTSRRKYVLANWKMYPTVEEALSVVTAVRDGLEQRARSGPALPRVIVCPPFVALAPVRAVVQDGLVELGAQNCHWEAEGPFTGEVSVPMLTGLVEYVLVGHSERRATGETDEQISRKVAAVAANGMVPVLFVGEEEPGGEALGETERRLRHGLSRIDVARQAVLVVYEPAWAIGADRAAPVGDGRRAVGHLKGVLAALGAAEPEVLYGGTVCEANLDELARIDVLDGLGATRASLRAEGLLRIVDAVRSAGRE